ncbi:MAG TPA: glycosyltransferase family 39 protein, partial [bacterium]|nr:glycosyltransferase family 39 protein [bacterium]
MASQTPQVENRKCPAFLNHWSRQILLLFFITGFFLRVLHLAGMTKAPDFHAPILDSLYHDLWATRFVQGQLPQEPYFRAPLYPTLLGCLYRFFGRDLFIPRIFGIFLGLGAAGLVLAIGTRVFGRAVGILSAGILLFYWPLIYHETELLIPATLVFLLMLALWNLTRALERPERGTRWLLTGVCFGLAAITRPNILLFMPVLAGWLVWREKARARAWLAVTLLTVGSIITIAPVTLRNYFVGRDFVLIASQGGINFYIGNNPESDGFTAKTPLGYNWHGDYEDSVALFAKRRAEKIVGHPMKASEISRFWFREGYQFWIESPAQALRLLARKLYLFWNAYEIKNNKNMYFQKRYSPVLRLPL